MTASKRVNNGDIFWQEDDGTFRKVTQDDIEDLDWDKRIKVYFNGQYYKYGDGLVLMLKECS